MAQRNRTPPVIWPAGIHYQHTDHTSRRPWSSQTSPCTISPWSNSLVPRWRSASRSGGTSETRRDVVTVRWPARGQSVGQSRISAATCCIVNLAHSSQTLSSSCTPNDLTPVAVNHAAHPRRNFLPAVPPWVASSNDTDSFTLLSSRFVCSLHRKLYVTTYYCTSI